MSSEHFFSMFFVNFATSYHRGRIYSKHTFNLCSEGYRRSSLTNRPNVVSIIKRVFIRRISTSASPEQSVEKKRIHGYFVFISFNMHHGWGHEGMFTSVCRKYCVAIWNLNDLQWILDGVYDAIRSMDIYVNILKTKEVGADR